MPDTAELSALLSDYLEQLDHRRRAVANLRREGGDLPVLDVVGDTVRRSDESARVLLQWLRAGEY